MLGMEVPEEDMEVQEETVGKGLRTKMFSFQS